MLGFVAESGLYKLIMRSDKPVAKDFQDWVTREVLPAIRKTGGYLLNEDMRPTAAADSREEFPMPSSFSDALRKLADEVERREQAEKVSKELAAARARDIMEWNSSRSARKRKRGSPTKRKAPSLAMGAKC